jgi:hypothetical protein
MDLRLADTGIGAIAFLSVVHVGMIARNGSGQEQTEGQGGRKECYIKSGGLCIRPTRDEPQEKYSRGINLV